MFQWPCMQCRLPLCSYRYPTTTNTHTHTCVWSWLLAAGLMCVSYLLSWVGWFCISRSMEHHSYRPTTCMWYPTNNIIKLSIFNIDYCVCALGGSRFAVAANIYINRRNDRACVRMQCCSLEIALRMVDGGALANWERKMKKWTCSIRWKRNDWNRPGLPCFGNGYMFYVWLILIGRGKVTRKLRAGFNRAVCGILSGLVVPW